jgi:phage gp29-like protein
MAFTLPRFFAKKAQPIVEANTSKQAAWFSDTVTDRVYTAFMSQVDTDMLLKEVGKTRADLRGLETDDEIAAAMDTRKDAVLSAPWRLESQPGPADDFIRQELTAFLPDILNVSFSALPYGYSVAEIVYAQRPDNRTGLSAITEKPFEWFEPQQDGSLVWLTAWGGRETLDTEIKFLMTRRGASWRNPRGDSLFSKLYWPWFFRHNAWRFWMRFLERFGDPLLLGKTHDPQGMVAALAGMGINNVVAVQSDEDVKAVMATGAGEFERVETALAKRIQKSILGQTLTSDVQGGGSYAASQTHNEVRHDKRNSDLRMITPAIQQVIAALWKINGFTGPAPLFAFQDDANIDMERANRDALLAQYGICNFTPEYLLRVYDFVEGDLAPDPVAAVTAPAKTFGGVNRTLAAASPAQIAALPDTVLATNLATAADPVMNHWVDELKARTDQAESLEQLRDAILEAYPDMDTASLADVMMQQQMIARCVGMMDVKSEETGISGVNEFAAQPTIHVEQKPATFNITLAEQPQPIINIVVPDQPAPVVNVINEVTVPDQPAPVINNQINVQPQHARASMRPGH